MNINKLTLSNSISNNGFINAVKDYNYDYYFNINGNLLVLQIESPLIIKSTESTFFYITTNDINSSFTDDIIQFASCGEIVIADKPFIIIYSSVNLSNVFIYSQKPYHTMHQLSLNNENYSTLEKYAKKYNDYYLGYEKRYAEVYKNGGTTWESIGPNQSLVQIMNTHPNLFKGKKVIDLGCGEGRDSIYLSSLGIDVVGVDISHSAIKKARFLSHTKGVTPQFLETNVLYLNGIPDSYFDTAINMGCLHMIVKDEERLSHIKNVYRILKPGGTFIIDHCQENWGKGFFSLPEELYKKQKLIVGNIIQRRIRTSNGEKYIPLEVIPYSEKKKDMLIKEISSIGFQSILSISTNTEAFGNSVLVAFRKPE